MLREAGRGRGREAPRGRGPGRIRPGARPVTEDSRIFITEQLKALQQGPEQGALSQSRQEIMMQAVIARQADI